VVLDQVVEQLKVDAASVLLYHPATQMLEHAAWRGIRAPELQRFDLRLGEGLPGQAALERRMLHVPDLRTSDVRTARMELLQKEQFVAYYAVPLLAKGKVQGVLEVFNRTSLQADSDWLDFLETLAGQAAIAIDNSALFDELQKSNVDLSRAYDTTLDGWSRALDLRDKETEGHSARVTEMTLRLARFMGFSEESLTHVRRGALLHDIGKMGIPDSILLKPGPLTDEEWVIMKMHPVYAVELLSPIEYLRPALDIPYCHHEKWDGSGYPRGLSGEQIPLAARIFALVDVWDALRSDRPYRAAWTLERVREHVRAGSGSHFDPAVVEAFESLNRDLFASESRLRLS
jgi:putative nucleotidyltransferase with HDIG domain